MHKTLQPVTQNRLAKTSIGTNHLYYNYSKGILH